MNKIEQFIKDNNLDFSGEGSSLNSNCVIIAGYACHLDIGYYPDLERIFTNTELSSEAKIELERVFDYAWENDYGDFWETDEAKGMYKF